MPETREPLPPFTGDLAALIAYARTLLEHRLVPLKQEAFRDLVAVAEQFQRLTRCDCWKHDHQVCDVCQGVSGVDTPDLSLDHLLADAEIRTLRDDGGGDRIAFLKEQP